MSSTALRRIMLLGRTLCYVNRMGQVWATACAFVACPRGRDQCRAAWCARRWARWQRGGWLLVERAEERDRIEPLLKAFES